MIELMKLLETTQVLGVSLERVMVLAVVILSVYALREVTKIEEEEMITFD